MGDLGISHPGEISCASVKYALLLFYEKFNLVGCHLHAPVKNFSGTSRRDSPASLWRARLHHIRRRRRILRRRIISGPWIAIFSLSHVAKNILTHHLDHQEFYLKQYLTHCLHDSVLGRCPQYSIFHAEHYHAVTHNPWPLYCSNDMNSVRHGIARHLQWYYQWDRFSLFVHGQWMKT